MTTKLTKNDLVFAKEVAVTGNRTQSASKAYNIKDPNYAGVKGLRLIRKDKILKQVEKEKIKLADAIPDDLLVQTHLEGLNAGKHIYKNNNETGEIEDMGVEPDYATRHKYLDSGYKLKGAYTDNQGKVNTLIPVLVKFLDKKDEGTDKTKNNTTLWD